MTTESADLISEIKQIMAQYRREVPGRRRAWPEAIKTRVKRLNDNGLSLYSIAQLIGIPYVTLKNWERKQNTGGFRAVTVKTSKPVTTVVPPTAKCPTTVEGQTVKPLTVVGSEQSSSIAITHPSGIRIEGLSFNEAVQLSERWLGL